MSTATTLALGLLLMAPTPGTSQSTRKSGKTTITVKVKARNARISMRSGAKRTSVTLKTASQCGVEKLSSILAREVAENKRSFEGLPGGSVRLAASAGALQDLERGLAAVLATGQHGVRGGRGATQFGGTSVSLGGLPPRAPAGGHGRNTKVTPLPRGGAHVEHRNVGPSGVVSTFDVTLRGDGSGTVHRTLGFGSGTSAVTISETSEFDSNGNASGGLAKVQTGGGVVFDEQSSGGGGSTDPSPSKEESGGDDDQQNENKNNQSQGGAVANVGDPTPSKEEGGGKTEENKESPNKQSQGGVTMGTDGTLTIPGLSLSDTTVAAVVNWNRLGAAVSTPDPTKDDETVTGGGGGGSPITGCSQLDQAGFNPNPKFLKPTKKGWATDPLPMLQGTERGRGRGRGRGR